MPNFTEAEFTARRATIKKAYDDACSAAQSATYDANWPDNWREVEAAAKTAAKKAYDEAMAILEAEYGDTAADEFFAAAGLK